MSMKATQFNIEFQQRVNKYNKKLEAIDEKIDNLNIQLQNIFSTMQNIQLINNLDKVSDKTEVIKDEFKSIDLNKNKSVFIPEIDTSDLTMNSSDEEKTIKDLNLDFGLGALDDIEEG